MSLFPSKFHRDLVLTQLRTLGVSTVQVSFAGSGDSGTIEGVYCQDAEGREIVISQDVTFAWPETRQVFEPTQKKWVTVTEEENKPLDKILEQLTYDALEDGGFDWYNNDGGQGRFNIDFTQSPPAITLEVGLNITTTEDHELDFSDEFAEEE